MIVHAIEETLDKGLQKDGQVVPMSKLAGALCSEDQADPSVPTFVFGVSYRARDDRALKLIA